MPSPLTALAALKSFLAGRAVPAVSRGALLAETVKAGDSRLADLVRRSRTPEQSIIEYGGHLNQALPSPKLVREPVALRWESAGRDLYDPGVVHYDASGGSALPDIIMGQPHYFQNDTGLPFEEMWEPLNAMLNRGQVRAARLSDIDPERAVYVPGDPWASSRAPELNGRAMFYPNLHEGRIVPESHIPRRISIEDILNDPALREEANLAVALPESSPAHRGSVVFKAEGGEVKAPEDDGYGDPSWGWMDRMAGKYLGINPEIAYAKRRPAELGLKGELGGEADAMRHLLISKSLREKYPRAAPFILGAREALTGFGEDRRLGRQDEINNALAAELMKGSPTQSDYEQRALEAIRSKKANVPFPAKKLSRGGLARFKECSCA